MSDPPPRDPGLESRVAEAVAAVRARTPLVPRAGLTLGSGLGGVVGAIEDATVIPTAELPHWPRSTVPGHAGRFAVGTWGGVPVAALAGRSHRYEGYALDQVTFAVRVMHALGARTLLFTSAVGGIHPELRPGDLVLATGHLNFIGNRGLLTPAERRARRAGRVAGETYSRALGRALLAAAAEAGVPLRPGVLAGGLGPAYETAAEVRMAAALGADVAGMSTVHEATLAAELGCEAASLSCVTNRATGLSSAPLAHGEVTEVADRAAHGLRRVLRAWLAGLPPA